LQIVVDHRERASGVPDVLGSLDTVELRFAELETGDYLIDDQLVVERKTVEDFAKSIVDTRLFRQASRLRQASCRSALIIEGRLSAAEIGVSREAMQGALISLSLIFHVPVLRAADKSETARLLVYAGRQLAGGEFELPPAVWQHRKPRRPWHRKLHLLQALPGVGRDRAERLLAHFGTIERCLSASEAELCEVPGIGVRTARAIRALVSDG
jgi:ERCC4-type nuclease